MRHEKTRKPQSELNYIKLLFSIINQRNGSSNYHYIKGYGGGQLKYEGTDDFASGKTTINGKRLLSCTLSIGHRWIKL